VITVAPDLDLIPISTTPPTMTMVILVMTLWTNMVVGWEEPIRSRQPITKMTSLPGTGPSPLEATQVFPPAPFLGSIIHLHSLIHLYLSERPHHSSPRQSSLCSIRKRHLQHLLGTYCPVPNASVISLPGLLMTAPSRIGMNTNAASTPVCIPEPSASLNTPVVADNGLRISTSSGLNQGFRTPDNGYSSIMSPTTPKDTNLSPETLGAEGGGGRGGGRESARYLQTHPPYSTRSSISGDDATSIYSSLSQDPTAAVIRLNQRAELTEAVAKILLRQDLLIRLCKSLIRYGAPSH
jgi:hypothetical protein